MNYKKIFICTLIIFLGFHIHAIRTTAMHENTFEQTEFFEGQTVSKLISEGSAGNIEAQFNLGFYYCDKQDYDNAIKWYELASKNGHALAQLNLGIIYKNLESPNYEKSNQYFLMAAKQNLPDAQFCLGQFYEYNTVDGKPNYEEAIKWYTLAANQNYADAQYALGLCYFSGNGVPKSYEKAITYFKLAAIQDHAEAQYYLGMCYSLGKGVPQDDKIAFKWCKLSAMQGYAYAQHFLGMCYKNGLGIEQDYQLAAQWYELAATQGNVLALYQLGNCYDLGQGVTKDTKKAFHLYVSAAIQGHANAQFNVGMCYYLGKGVTQNYQNAMLFFESAAKQNHSEAKFNLGLFYVYGILAAPDYVKAMSLYTEAAEQGYIDAQVHLGKCYEIGLHGAKKDLKEAIKWYTLAANQGCDESQYKLGYFYNTGQGVKQNFQEAFKWFSMAAAQENMLAQYQLGNFYNNGQVVKQNFQEAERWYTQAALQGHAESLYILGVYYETGKEGIPKNLQKAFDYYTRATYKDHKKAYLQLGKFYFFGLGTQQNIIKAASLFFSAYQKDNSWTESSRFITSDNVQTKIVDLCNQFNSIKWSTTPVSTFIKRYLRKHLKLIGFLNLNGIIKIVNGKILLNKDELEKTACEPLKLNMLLLEAADALESARSIFMFEHTADNARALAHLNALLIPKPYKLGEKDIILYEEFFLPYAKSKWRTYHMEPIYFTDAMILANMYGIRFAPNLIHCETITKNENIYDYIFGSTGRFKHRLYTLSSHDGGLMRHLLAREMYWLRSMTDKQVANQLNDEEQTVFEVCKSLIETHFVSATGACANELADIIILWASDIDACEEAMGIGTKICDQTTFDAHLFTKYRHLLAEKILNIEYLESLIKKGTSTEPIKKIYKAITSNMGPEFRNFYRFIVSDILNIIPSVGSHLAIDPTITREDIENILSDTIQLVDISTLAQNLYQNLADKKDALEDTPLEIVPIASTDKYYTESSLSESKITQPHNTLPIKEHLALEIEKNYKISCINFCKIVDQTCNGNFLKRLNDFLNTCSSDMDEDAVACKKNIDEWIKGNIMLTVSELVNIIFQLDPYFKHTEIIPELARFNTIIGCKNKKAAEYYGTVLYPIYLLREGFIGIN